jgi:hypothetical protein
MDKIIATPRQFMQAPFKDLARASQGAFEIKAKARDLNMF